MGRHPMTRETRFTAANSASPGFTVSSVGASPAVKEQRTIVPRALGCAAGRSVQLPLSADLLGCVGRGVRIKILPTRLSPCRASISKVHGRPVQYGLVSGAISVGHSGAHQRAAAAHSFSIKICVFLACTRLRQGTNNASRRAAHCSTGCHSHKPSRRNDRPDVWYCE